MGTPQMLTRTITMVKKLMPDGSPCRKCNEIQERLEKDGLQDRIDSVLYMDPNTPGVDAGTKIAMQHGIKTAPFFVVRTLTADSSDGQDAVHEDVYTAYLRMKKQVSARRRALPRLTTTSPCPYSSGSWRQLHILCALCVS